MWGNRKMIKVTRLKIISMKNLWECSSKNNKLVRTNNKNKFRIVSVMIFRI